MRTVLAGAALALVLAAPASAQATELIGDNGFESSTAGFEPFSPLDGSVSLETANPIAGASSLHAGLNAFGRVSFTHFYGFGSGPVAQSVSVAGKLRVEAGGPVVVCAIAYLLNDPEPREACRSVSAGGVVDASASVPVGGRQLDRVLFQVRLETGGTAEATLDDAHLVVSQAVDLIDDNGFDASTNGFEPFSPLDGSGALGESELRVELRPYGRVMKTHFYGYGSGPRASSLGVEGAVRVERGRPVRVCAIAYFFLDREPRSACSTVRRGTETSVSLRLPTDGRRLDRVLYQLTNDGGTSSVALDDAHLLVSPLE